MRFLALLCLICAPAYAAFFTANATGNWSSTSTWQGGVVPPTDGTATILVNGDVVVTVQATDNLNTASVVVGNTANSTGISTLNCSGGTWVLSGSNTMKIGQGAGKDGKIIFGPGFHLTIPAGFYWQNAVIASTATANNPAIISGAGQVDTTGVTDPTQDINLANVSFQNTGIVKMVAGATTGAETSRILVTNCVFAGTSAINFGNATTPGNSSIAIDKCDFRDLGGTKTITFNHATLGTATYELKHCTWSQGSGQGTLDALTANGLSIDGCVFQNVFVGKTTTGLPGATLQNSIGTINVVNSGLFAMSDSATVGCTVQYNYMVPTLVTGTNLHPIQTVGTGGSGTHNVLHNVLDATGMANAADQPDMLMANPTPLAIVYAYNIGIYSNEMVNGAHGPNYANGITIHNDTNAGTCASALSNGGDMFRTESTTPNAGNVTIRSSLMTGNGQANESAVIGTDSGGSAQVILYADYNCFNGCGGGAYASARLTVTSGISGSPLAAPHDKNTVNPNYVDSSRNLGVWNKFFGSGTSTIADAIPYLLAGLNGYRGTPNFDQQGAKATYAPRHAVDWVSYGYSPTDLRLRGAGDPADGSPDIGAMPVRTKCPVGFF